VSGRTRNAGRATACRTKAFMTFARVSAFAVLDFWWGAVTKSRLQSIFRISVSGLLTSSLVISTACAQGGSSEAKPVITVNKYVVGRFSSYEFTVFSNGQVSFYGIATRVDGSRTIRLSSEQYRRALRLFEEIDFAKLESGPASSVVALATVTLERDGVRKSVSFPSTGGTGREYAVLITSLEEILGLRDLICPRLSRTNGKPVDLCLVEARFMEQELKGAK